MQAEQTRQKPHDAPPRDPAEAKQEEDDEPPPPTLGVALGALAGLGLLLADAGFAGADVITLARGSHFPKPAAVVELALAAPQAVAGLALGGWLLHQRRGPGAWGSAFGLFAFSGLLTAHAIAQLAAHDAVPQGSARGTNLAAPPRSLVVAWGGRF